MKKLLLTLPVCALACFAAHAQSIGPSTLNAAGGSAVIAGNTFEYAVGDVVAGNTLSSATLVVTQGVLQPARIGNAVGTVPGALTGISVYPSPVADVLYLQPALGKAGTLQYTLYDAAGKLILTKSAVLTQGNERQQADVHDLAAGQYMLQVQWLEGNNRVSGAYKIQKLK